MPELPEVEIVCRGLSEELSLGSVTINKIEMGKKSLRVPFQRSAIKKSHGQKILSIKRKAKYILFELEKNYLISHLGMTGSWRVESHRDKHDHVRLFLEDGRTLTYRDPRRFGQFDIINKENIDSDKRFIHLGPDPVTTELFTGDYLYKMSRKKSIAIKTLIMNQEVVVGVGNIYASEALYLAGVKPTKKAYLMRQKECNVIVSAVVETLNDAIFCGGSTISDFRQAGGSKGYFQNFFFVYGRENNPCLFCRENIISKVITGRNSFWCPSCQN